MPYTGRPPPLVEEGEPIPARLNLRCLSCGYALTGLTVHRCPECGEPFDPRETWRGNRDSDAQGGYAYVGATLDAVIYWAGWAFLAGYLVTLWLWPIWLITLPMVLLAELLLYRGDANARNVRFFYLGSLLGFIWMLWLLL